MAYQKKSKTAPQAAKGANVLNSEDERKRFKSALAVLTQYYQEIDDARDGCKETVADLAAEYGLDKSLISKIARTMYKHAYTDILEENRHFEIIYETVVEGKLRDEAVNALLDTVPGGDEDDFANEMEGQ
jgi:ribosome-binding protein aMBF1 (putative translation factor)